MLAQNSLHLILNIAGIAFYTHQAIATSCQVYPSEYAYRDDSVTRTESVSANCRSYPAGNAPASVHPEDYIHCDGAQLKLTDSNFGQEQYQPTDYYVWSSSAGLLLFIFSTRVSLTTIKLHYYSDSTQGLPRLRFYAVPDDFDVWDASKASYPQADVASILAGGGPAAHKNVSINVNFNTKRVQMYKSVSTDFQFSASEVEFFTCIATPELNTISTTSIASTTMASSSTPSVQTTSDVETTTNFTETLNRGFSFTIPANSFADSNNVMQRSQLTTAVIIAIGVSTTILLILSSALVITAAVLIINYRRRSAKQDFHTDALYSTLNRGSEQQVQHQYMQQNSNDLYDQIHLSPSTGQTEFIPKPQSESINNSHPINSDTENSMNGVSVESEVNSPPATYAAIDNSKRKKVKKCDTKHTAAEKCTEKVSPTKGVSHTKGVYTEGKDNSIKRNQKPLDGMHTSDYQDRDKVNNEHESNPTPSIEELYTAVKKKPKGSSVVANEQAAEDLYTAVMKKPKKGSVNDEVVPSIPPHTIEELYTAVNKKPKGNTMENEEEAPPIPPHTVDDSF